MNPLRQTVSRTAGPIATIGAVGGFIADVLQPLANLAPIVMVVALLVAIGSAISWAVLRRQRGQQAWESSMPILFALSAPTFLIFGLWTAVLGAGPERGYLAENVEPIGALQAQLLGIEEDVTAIRETTEQTAEEVGTIRETTDDTQAEVEGIATAQAQGFADLQAAFAQLQSSDTIIASPATPQEWYSNARLYELKGDNANAIAAYEGYLDFGLEYVDPIQRYADLLTTTEGVSRARTRLGDLLGRHPANPSLQMVAALLADAPEAQLAALREIATREPLYGPVWNELGKAYDRQLRQGITREILGDQSEAYSTLFELEEAQNFSRFFIDKEAAAEALDEARVLFEAYQVSREVSEAPDVFTNFVPGGVLFIVSLTEMGVKELRFGIDEPEPTRTTGMNAMGTVNASIGPVPAPPGEHILYFQYVDQNDVESPIFEEPFTILPISIQFQQNPTDFSTGRTSAVFVLYPTGVAEGTLVTYAYSVDDDSLSESVIGAPYTSITVEGLSVGDHRLFIQAVEGASTEVVEFPFTIQ